jgi:hypothetical protein
MRLALSRLFSRMYKFAQSLPLVLVALVVGGASFTTTAYALSLTSASNTVAQVTTDDSSLIDLARPVYDAFVNHQYGLMIPLAIVLIVALLRRLPGKVGTFMHSDFGGTISALSIGGATAVGAALAVPGAHVTFDILKAGFAAGVLAAGGYAVLKHVFVDPVLPKLAALAPSWLQPILNLFISIFDHSTAPKQPPTAEVVNKATTAGTAAVAANPGQGAAAVVGAPVEVK